MTEQEYAELEATIENRRKLKAWEADYKRNCRERAAQHRLDKIHGTLPKSVVGSYGEFHTAGGDFARIQRAYGCLS